MENVRILPVDEIPEGYVRGKNNEILDEFLKMNIKYAMIEGIKNFSYMNTIIAKRKLDLKAVRRQNKCYLINLRRE